MRISMMLVPITAVLALAGSVLVSPAIADDTCQRASGDEAIAACTRIIQNHETSTKYRAAAYYNRGVLYRDKGDHDRAIADYNEAIRLDPKFPQAYSNRGVAYHAKGDHDRSIADYNEAIRLDPEYPTAYYNRGLAKESKGDSAGGDADIARARELNPNIGR